MGAERRMANGEWRMANGEWRMANGEWRMAMIDRWIGGFHPPAPSVALPGLIIIVIRFPGAPAPGWRGVAAGGGSRGFHLVLAGVVSMARGGTWHLAPGTWHGIWHLAIRHPPSPIP